MASTPAAGTTLITVPVEVRRRIYFWTFKNTILYVKPPGPRSDTVPELPRKLSILIACRRTYLECKDNVIQHVIVRSLSVPLPENVTLTETNYFERIRTEPALKSIQHINLKFEDLWMLQNKQNPHGSLQYTLPEARSLTIWHRERLLEELVDLIIDIVKPVKGRPFEHLELLDIAKDVLTASQNQRVMGAALYLRRQKEIIEEGKLSVAFEFCIRTSKYLEAGRIVRAKLLPGGKVDMKLIDRDDAVMWWD